jgi:leucyl aminopeptidase
MKIEVFSQPIEKLKTSLLALGIFDDKKLDSDAASMDKALNGIISDLITEFKPDFKQSRLLYIGNGWYTGHVKQIALIGLGKRGEFDIDKLRRASAIAAKLARQNRIKNFATLLHKACTKDDIAQVGRAVAEGTLLAMYKFSKYKTEKDDFTPESLMLVDRTSKKLEEGIRVGSILAESTNYVREIVNSPACFVTPTAFADEAKRVAKKHRLKITTLDKNGIEKMGMNALLGVSLGSSQHPRFIVMEYKVSKKKDKIAIVGKGITFDSGGLDLKPAQYMETMKLDKAGAAAVIGIMQAAARLRLPINIVGAMPVTENMPGPSAQKPGDIVTAYNKKTIEIINTDAEGRLILADALSYVEEKYKPKIIIDLATLTGAVVIALGYHAAGVLGNDQKLIDRVKGAGQKSFERVWQLPLWSEHKEAVKSEVADVANAFRASLVDAGTINGAAFLSNFVKTSWVHVDIAGTAWSLEEREYIPKAATGYGVRLVAQLLMDLAEEGVQ